MERDIFLMLHLTIDKEIKDDDIIEDLYSILEKNGYHLCGNLGECKSFGYNVSQRDEMIEIISNQYREFVEKLDDAW